MRNSQILSNHWSDDQLIAHLYGILPEDRQEAGHLSECKQCSRRLEAMQANRVALETEHPMEAALRSDALARQRRSIYARIEGSDSQIWKLRLRNWAAVACGAVVVSTAGWMWEHSTELRHHEAAVEMQRARVSDEQLVDDASDVAERSEPKAVAPLQALFEN